jgi:hypothetical protein
MAANSQMGLANKKYLTQKGVVFNLTPAVFCILAD